MCHYIKVDGVRFLAFGCTAVTRNESYLDGKSITIPRRKLSEAAELLIQCATTESQRRWATMWAMV